MSLSLGEKLRQAREERGISIREVAEQTRISPVYLESIENDDYKPLPGGIFNKGFVKSYARFIGFDEQEALNDYMRIAASNDIAADHPLKVYRPEVLTDDRSSSSMLPTILFAGVILALMTGGILFVLNYLQNQDKTGFNSGIGNTNANLSNSQASNSAIATGGNIPRMADLKIEFRAVTEPVSLSSTLDGKSASATIEAGRSVTFEPKDSLKLRYSKSLAASVQLVMNGKTIALPEAPQNPRRNAIEFDINKDNFSKIWQEGRIAFEEPVASEPYSNSAANMTNVSNAPAPTPTRPPITPAPRPTVTATRSPGPGQNSNAANVTPRPSPN